MNVQQMIEYLQKLPPEKEVSIFWDGSARGGVDGIVNADEEVVIVGDWSIYRDKNHRVYPERQIVYG